jgi:CheY-like chemotaxis protein
MPEPIPFISNNKKINFNGKHILIAEDEPINMLVCFKMLQACNATVSKAVTGNEVIQILNEGIKPDLILLDIKMPEMDGYITLEIIKEIYPDIIVLAFTASLIDAETERFLIHKGFSGIIPKPFKPEFFYEKISAALGMH